MIAIGCHSIYLNDVLDNNQTLTKLTCHKVHVALPQTDDATYAVDKRIFSMFLNDLFLLYC